MTSGWKWTSESLLAFNMTGLSCCPSAKTSRGFSLKCLKPASQLPSFVHTKRNWMVAQQSANSQLRGGIKRSAVTWMPASERWGFHSTGIPSRRYDNLAPEPCTTSVMEGCRLSTSFVLSCGAMLQTLMRRDGTRKKFSTGQSVRLAPPAVPFAPCSRPAPHTYAPT